MRHMACSTNVLCRKVLARAATPGTRLYIDSPDPAAASRQVNTWDLSGDAPAPVVALPAVAGTRVKSFAASGDGALAVVVLFDSSIGVWDLRLSARTRSLQKRGAFNPSESHSGGINAVYLSPDASHALTVSKVRLCIEHLGILGLSVAYDTAAVDVLHKASACLLRHTGCQRAALHSAARRPLLQRFLMAFLGCVCCRTTLRAGGMSATAPASGSQVCCASAEVKHL